MRKKVIPQRVRRGVASRYGCLPGESLAVACHYCGKEGRINWLRLSTGRPGAWVHFSDLELDHVIAESSGGRATVENIVLACRRCNRSKGTSSAPKRKGGK